MADEHYNLVVFGAGSGGIGAALAALRLGLSAALIESSNTIGGTVVRGGVHVWEPCAGSTGLPFEIYSRLRQFSKAVAIYSHGRHCCRHTRSDQPPFPGGENIIDPNRRYLDTLQVHGANTFDESFTREHFHGVVFNPEVYMRVVEDMLAAHGAFHLSQETTVSDVRQADGFIHSVALTNGKSVGAEVYVDATGDGRFCLACGCEALLGRDSRRLFNEPDAPDEADLLTNAVTLIYRVSPATRPEVTPLPAGIPSACWWRKQFPVVSATQCPWGDYHLNMLPTMEYREMVDLGGENAYRECCRRVRAHWHHIQADYPEFRRYRLSWIAPSLGVRESNRIVCEYMLTENDILAGFTSHSYHDIIALADHGLDRHGKGGSYRGLIMPYGIPYRCLIPKGYQNLLVACRAAGFSSLAASSCRLSRTMLQLGQAAGTAAALATKRKCPVAQVPLTTLRQMLSDQHVQLDWPMPETLRKYISLER
jgi:hypothetical protein